MSIFPKCYICHSRHGALYKEYWDYGNFKPAVVYCHRTCLQTVIDKLHDWDTDILQTTESIMRFRFDRMRVRRDTIESIQRMTKELG